MSKGPAANGRQLTLFQSGFGKEVAPAIPQCSITTSTALANGSDVITIDDEDEDDVILAMLPEDQVCGLQRSSAATCDGGAAFSDDVDTSTTAWSGLDAAASSTWVYPINYPLRQYQYSITRAALFSNTLVSLPTGLGKTFIAAVVMYNFYRWYPSRKIVFMAPTKPLVAQQITACFNIVGIPKSDTAEVTGAMSPSARRVLWRSRRVFYLTPQVLINDLTSGAADAAHFCCVVVDEAHKAQGNYAYCMVIKELCRYTTQFRVLALTATPGSLVDNIQQVLSNLLISHIEHRTEDSLDITPYSHRRCMEKIVVPIGDTITRYKNKFMEVIGVFMCRIRESRLVYGRSDSSITKYMLLKARETYQRSHPPGRGDVASRQLEADFAVCLTLYHALELLTIHGLRCFYSFIYSAVTGDKVSARTRSQLQRNDTLSELLQELGAVYGTAIAATEPSTSPATSHHQIVPASTLDLVSHPKLEQLRLVVEQHFQQMAERVDSTRVMIFSQYRDSVLEIVDTLKGLQPTVRAMHFIGQSSGRSSRGFSQKEQLKVLREFRRGGYNTLVSTCVGEEGLDIGDVDLIICYDVSRSPIRLVQRMGRTGRKRQGRIVVLLTAGREEASYNQSMQQKKSIIKSLTAGTRLQNYLYKNSPRMLPAGIEPKCLRLHMKVAPPSPAPSTTAKPARTRVKRDAQTRSDPTSDLVSRLARPAPRTSDTSGTYLLPHELEDYRRRFELDEDLLPAMRASVCEWLPWQTTLQCSYAVGHSLAAHALVNALQHMDALAITDDTALIAEHADVRSHLAPDSPDIAGVGSKIHKPDQQATPERPVTSDSLAELDDIMHLTEQQQMAEAMRQSLLLNVSTAAPSELDWNQLLFVDSDFRWQGVRSPPGLFEGWTADVDELERLVEVVVEESLLDKNEGNLLYAEVIGDDDGLFKSPIRRNALPCALKEGAVFPSEDMSFVARGAVLLSEEDQSPILPSQSLTSRRKHRAVIKAAHHLGRSLFGSSSPLSVNVDAVDVDVRKESKLPILLTGSLSDDDFQSCDSIEQFPPVEAKYEQSRSCSEEQKRKLALPLQVGVGEVQQSDRPVADQSAVLRCRRSSCDDLFDDDSILEGMETSLPPPPLIQAGSAVFEHAVGAVMPDGKRMSLVCPEIDDIPAVDSSAQLQIGAAPSCISGHDSHDHQEPLFDLISLDLDSEDMVVSAVTDNTLSSLVPASVVELTDEGREAGFHRNPSYSSGTNLRPAGGQADISPQMLSTAVSTLSSSSPLMARSKLSVTQLIELIDQKTPTVDRSDRTAIRSSSVSASLPCEAALPPDVVMSPPGVVVSPPGVVASPPDVVASPPGVVASPPGVVVSSPGVIVMKASDKQPEEPVFSFLDDLLDEDETQFDADARQEGQEVCLRPQDKRSSTPLHSCLSRGHLGVSSAGQGTVLPSPIAAIESDVPVVCADFRNPLTHVTPKRRFDATETPKKPSTSTAPSLSVSGRSCSSADTPFGPLARRPGRRNKPLLIRSPSQSPAADPVSVCQRSASSTVITIDSEDDDDVFVAKGGGAAGWLSSRGGTADKTADDRRPAASNRTRQPQRDDRSKKQRKGRLRPARNPFLDCEAELSATSAMDDTDGSSEDEQDDDADDSIIDDQPALTQDGIDMRAIYLRSVRSPNRAARDRLRPCTMSDSQIFSQAPIQDAHYIQDSFCVSDDHQDSEGSCSSVCEVLQDSVLCRERTPSPQSLSPHGPRRAKRRRVLALPSSGEDSSPSPRGCRHPPVTSMLSPNRPTTPPAATTTSLSRVNPQCVLPSPFKIPFSSPSMLTSTSLRLAASPKASFSLSPAAASSSPSLVPLAAAAVSSQRRARLDRARAKQSEYRRRMELPTADAVGQGTVGKWKHLRRSDADSHPTPFGTSTAPSEKQTVMVVSSREISCASSVVSDLRSVHGVVIHVTSLPYEDYVISSRAAALRCLVSSVSTAAGRKKLLLAVGRLQLMYSRCVLVLERDRVKEVAGAPPPLPPRALMQLVARLVRPSTHRLLHVLHSSGQVDTARLLYAACLSERKAGFCLPLLSTPEQSSASSYALHDARRRLLSTLPGCSVALSETILTRFRTLADFFNSGPDDMHARLEGVVSRQRCVEIAQFVRRRLMSDLTV